MLAEKLVRIIEGRADEIARAWYRDVRESNYTPSFKKVPQDDALQMATNIYRKLGYWLLPESEQEVQRVYERFGGSLYHMGFRMEEMVMTLILIKRHLWLHLLEEGLMATNLEIQQALELNNRVVLYFDRSIYFAVIGYKQARVEDRAAG